MKHAKRIIPVLSILLLAINIFGQDSQSYWKKLDTGSNSISPKIVGKIYPLKFTPIELYFYHSKWARGNIYLVNSDSICGQNLMYNSFLDELVLYNEKLSQSVIVEKSIINEFVTFSDKGEKELFRKYYYDMFPKGFRIFKVIYDGDIKLLKYYSSSERVTTNGKKEIQLVSSYFFYTIDNSLIKIKPTKRSIIKAFTQNRKEVRKFFKITDIGKLSDQKLKEVLRTIDSHAYKPG